MDVLTAPLTGDEWDHLVGAGLLDGQPIELVGGRKIVMSPQSSLHAATTQHLLYALLGAASSQGLQVRPANTLALSPLDRPEPDLAVVRARDDHYRDGHPGPDDVLLVVEVSRTSVAFDLGDKAARYAAAGIREYWVVDVAAQVVHVHGRPSTVRSGYDDVTGVPFGAPLHTRTFDAEVVLPASG